MELNDKKANSNLENEISKMYNKIEELKLIINKKEDYIKNIINEKDDTIKKLNEKILNDEKEIKTLNNIINELRNQNEKEFKEKEKKINSINNKVLNHEKELKNLEEKNIKFSIRQLSDNEFRMKFCDELIKVESLELNYGFLSKIGIKLLKLEKDYEINGFIKAPDNSPYKDGIFNFRIEYPYNYRVCNPSIFIKTKIFHCNTNDDGYCPINLLEENKKIYELHTILSFLYVFFIKNNPDCSYSEATDLYKHDYSSFKNKCSEYVKQYALSKFDDNSKYLFRDYYINEINFSRSELRFLFIDLNLEPTRVNLFEEYDSLGNIIKYHVIRYYNNINLQELDFIVENMAFDSESLINLSDYTINKIKSRNIFVIPRIKTNSIK